MNSEGTVAFRLNAFARSSNAYRDDKENWQVAINPAVSFSLGQESYLTASFEYARNDYKPDSGIPLLNKEIPDVPRTRSYQSPFDFSDQRIARARLDFSTLLGSSVVLRNKFYYTDLDWKTDGTIFPGVLPEETGDATVYRSLLQLDDRQQLFGNQTEAILDLKTGSIRHALVLGFEVRRLGDRFTLDLAALPPIGLMDPIETATQPGFKIPGQSQTGDTRSWNLAPYFIDQVALSASLNLSVGGRFDTLDFEDSLSGLSRDSKKFSPLFGVSYSPVPGFAVYGSIAQAFGIPSSRVIGEIEPEESTQFELGVKKEFGGGKTFLNLAFYHLDKDSIAIVDETGVFRQTGNQRSRGVELDVAGELGLGLFAFGSYAFTDAELTEFREWVDPSFGQLPPVLVDRSGNRPPFAPEHTLALSLIKEFGSGLSLGAGGRYLSRQFIAADNLFAIDQSLLLHASIGYRLETWKFNLNLKNLTNTDFETRGFGANSVLPGNPFAIYLGVDFER
jgi:iron complex outermembrane receptor protein